MSKTVEKQHELLQLQQFMLPQEETIHCGEDFYPNDEQ